MNQVLSYPKKVRLTSLIIAVVILTGVCYQYQYHKRQLKYQKMIQGYYLEYFGREADAIGLRHWTTWALNKWGIEKVRRLGFEEAKKKGAS